MFVGDRESKLEIAKQFIVEGFANGNLSAFDRFLAPNVTVVTGLSPTKPIVGAQNYQAAFSEFSQAWGLKSFDLDDIFGAEDKVVVRFTANCVFQKDFWGVKATKQIVPLKEVFILTFDRNQIVEIIVSGINFPFEYIMYPVLKDIIIGELQTETEL